jgi:hypothetical protein
MVPSSRPTRSEVFAISQAQQQWAIILSEGCSAHSVAAQKSLSKACMQQNN